MSQKPFTIVGLLHATCVCCVAALVMVEPAAPVQLPLVYGHRHNASSIFY